MFEGLGLIKEKSLVFEKKKKTTYSETKTLRFFLGLRPSPSPFYPGNFVSGKTRLVTVQLILYVQIILVEKTLKNILHLYNPFFAPLKEDAFWPDYGLPYQKRTTEKDEFALYAI